MSTIRSIAFATAFALLGIFVAVAVTPKAKPVRVSVVNPEDINVSFASPFKHSVCACDPCVCVDCRCDASPVVSVGRLRADQFVSPSGF